RVDVLAADLQHVLVAAHETEVTVGAQEAHVAGVHPAVLVDGGGGGLGLVVVAAHEGVAADEDLAGSVRGLIVAGGGIDHADFVAGGGIAGGFARLLFRRVEAADGGADAELAHAVAGDQRAEELAGAVADLDRAGHAGGEDAGADAGDV